MIDDVFDRQLKTALSRRLPAPVHVRGVYFLLLQGDIVYVGQSDNIFNRVLLHEKTKEFDEFCYAEIPDAPQDILDHIEAEFIVRLKPALNQTIPPSKTYATKHTVKKLFNLQLSQVNHILKRHRIKFIEGWDTVFMLADFEDALQLEKISGGA